MLSTKTYCPECWAEFDTADEPAGTWYRGSCWHCWRMVFDREVPDGYIVCSYSFGWVGEWLAGPFDTFDEADAAREPARRRFPAGAVTPAVIAIVRRDREQGDNT